MTIISATDITASTYNGGQLAGFRNKIINGDFLINQRVYVSGASRTAGQYTLDRWKVSAAGNITFSTSNNKRIVTIPSGQTIQQVVEGINLKSGVYVLSWEGTAQGRIGSGSYGTTGQVTATIIGGTNTTIEFGPGTVTNVQFELGEVPTAFEERFYGLELSLCQRYYNILRLRRKFYNSNRGSINDETSIVFPEMRITPLPTRLTLHEAQTTSGITTDIYNKNVLVINIFISGNGNVIYDATHSLDAEF